MRDLVRQIAVVLSTIAVIVVNGLANALPLNGQGTGEISDRFDVFFVPAGYVFAIWGLIYLALAAYTIYQALPAQRQNPRLQDIGWLYVLSCAANIIWLFLWHYEIFVGTIIAMGLLLVLLLAIYLILGSGRTPASAAETWLVRWPFSIYLGWITVATVANATSLLDYLGWSGWGIAAEWWAVIMLLVATGLTVLMSLTRGDVGYALVIVWAFIGIAVKQSGTPLVAVVAGFLAGFVLGTLWLGLARSRPSPQVAWTVGTPEVGVRDRW